MHLHYTVGQVQKFLVGLAGLGGQMVNAGVVPEAWKPWVSVALAAVTAAGVYAVPNADGQLSPRSAEGDPYEPVEEPPADDEPAADPVSVAAPPADPTPAA